MFVSFVDGSLSSGGSDADTPLFAIFKILCGDENTETGARLLFGYGWIQIFGSVRMTLGL